MSERRAPYTVLSLGWGVQSWTIAAMVALGELPPIDVAIHADTTHEMSGTYEHARKWTPWLEERGVKIVTVSDAEQAKKVTTHNTSIFIPAFTIGEGAYGILRRQCTSRWKITPIRKYIREHRTGAHVEQWIGISTDEAVRMKPADVKYITHSWPLIEKNMSRWDCRRWLQERGLDIPVSSSCVFCPYHDSATWRELRISGNGDWDKAVAVDEAIRKERPPYDLFVHPARVPLVDVDLRNLEDRGQLRLWDEECDGMCGI